MTTLNYQLPTPKTALLWKLGIGSRELDVRLSLARPADQGCEVRRLPVHQQADLEHLGGKPDGGVRSAEADGDRQPYLPRRRRRVGGQARHHHKGVERREE